MELNSGYMSPEYSMNGQFTTKSDVFSFGVRMLKTISGKKNSAFYHCDRLVNLLGYVSCSVISLDYYSLKWLLFSSRNLLQI